MDLKTSLLQERTRILKELEDTDKLLMSRCGWTPPDAPPKPPVVVSDPSTMPLVIPNGRPYKIPVENGTDVKKVLPIAYAQEAELWLKEALPAFTAVDFRQWLQAKYGEEAVNESSVRGPFKNLEDSGRIVAIVPGAGRRPTTYRKA